MFATAATEDGWIGIIVLVSVILFVIGGLVWARCTAPELRASPAGVQLDAERLLQQLQIELQRRVAMCDHEYRGTTDPLMRARYQSVSKAYQNLAMWLRTRKQLPIRTSDPGDPLVVL